MEDKRRPFDRRQAVLLLIAAAMVIVFIPSVYLPKAGQLNSLEASLEQSRIELEAMTARSARVPVAAAELENLVPQYQLNLRRVPQQDHTAEFLHEISTVLAEEQTKRRELIPGASRPGEGCIESPIAITFDSSFTGAYRTISRIEQLDRMSRMDSIRISALPDDSGLVRVELRLVIFHTNAATAGSGATKGKVPA